MNSDINKIISSMNEIEIRMLIDELKKLLSKQEDNLNNNSKDKCPYCNSTLFIKYGKRNNNQCYLCKNCNKTFTNKTNSLTHYSKISSEKWHTFIECEFAGMTLAETSFQVKLSKTSCFNLRHKLYAICSEYIRNIKMIGQTELDCSYTKINLKGTKPNNMPRLSKKRGGTSEYSGISHHKVCVIVSTDEYDNIFMKIAGLGPESYEKYKKYSDTFSQAELIVSDSKSSIAQFSNYLGKEQDKILVKPNIKRYTTENGNNISTLNEICKIISDITHKRHGVGTCYLNDYLSFNCIKKMISYKVERKDYYNELSKIISNIPSQPYGIMPVDLKEAYWEYNYGIYKH